MQLNKAILFGVSLRLTVAWLVFTVGALLWGEQFIRFFLPFMSSVISSLQTDYWPVLSISDDKPGLIHMVATTRHSIPSIALEGARLTAGAHITHALVPFVIYYCMLIACPQKSFKRRMWLLLLSLPVNWLLAASTVPFQLAGHIEMLFQDLAKKYSAPRDESFLLSWMYFLEVGGRWLIPIILAVVSCLSFQWGLAFNEAHANRVRQAKTKKKKKRA